MRELTQELMFWALDRGEEVGAAMEWKASLPRMDARFDQADLERCRKYVGNELQRLAPSFERAGLHVTDVRIDEDNNRPFPDIVVCLVSKYVEGERELRHYLGSTGALLNEVEVARDIYIWSTVNGAAGIEGLGRSRRT